MTDASVPAEPPRAVLRHRDFRLFLGIRFLAMIAAQMQAVAVAWQVYDITRDPLALGLVGLAQFLPMAGFILPAGDLADRFDRRIILALGYLAQGLCAAVLLLLATTELSDARPLYLVLMVIGAARGLSGPSLQSFAPLLVPQAQFPNAVAWSSTVHQVATILGPAIGGGLYVLGATAVYGACLAAFMIVTAAVVAIRTRGRRYQVATGETALIRFLAGIAYLRIRPVILGAIALDLFAVLVGGASALLPIYARDILQIGSDGLGLMRSAQAAGAAATALVLASVPLRRHAGSTMLICVALFGVATVVFGLSENFALSLAALAAIGALDMISVFVRSTLIQLATPDPMRGRVSAVNMLCIGASNELGEFRAGLVAAWLGAVPAVVLGGLGTIAVVAGCAWLVPELRKIDRLSEVKPLDG